jgi:hypothetical protein
MVVTALVKAYPNTVTIEDLREIRRGEDIDESVARLQIDGLAVRFGDWVKASEPAVRYAQLARHAQEHSVRGLSSAA